MLQDINKKVKMSSVNFVFWGNFYVETQKILFSQWGMIPSTTLDTWLKTNLKIIHICREIFFFLNYKIFFLNFSFKSKKWYKLKFSIQHHIIRSSIIKGWASINIWIKIQFSIGRSGGLSRIFGTFSNFWKISRTTWIDADLQTTFWQIF